MRVALLAALALCLALAWRVNVCGAAVFGRPGRALADMPNPNIDPVACGRANVPRSAVCDPDHKLTNDEKDEIEGYINKISTAQVAVAVVEKMSFNGLSTSDVDLGAERFARGLHDAWGVGSVEAKNGIVVFVAIADRMTYISTGSGVMNVLTYDAIQSLIQHMRPLLRKRQFGSALANCMIHIDLLLSGKGGAILNAAARGPKAPDEESAEFLGSALLLVLFVGIGTLLQYRSAAKTRRYARSKEALGKLMKAVDPDNKDEAQAQYFTSSCPICLDDFPVAHGDSDHKEKPMVLPSDPRAPHALQCGHIFCKGCLEDFLLAGEGSKCPMCRAPVDDMPPPPQESLPRRTVRRLFRSNSQTATAPQWGATTARLSPLPSAMTPTASGSVTQTMTVDRSDPLDQGPGQSSAHAPEIRFRLHRMRSLYPDILSLEMLRAMDSSIAQGSMYDLRNQLDARQIELQHTLDDIRRASAASARSNGMSGSASPFGGGGSGGGGGGSW